MNCADCCLPCCKYTSFFAIFFYFSMGFIILFQSQYLKFHPSDTTNSGIVCFLTAGVEILIFVGLTWCENKRKMGGITRPEYLKFHEEDHSNRDRPRASSIKGIAMVDLSDYKKTEEHEELDFHSQT